MARMIDQIRASKLPSNMMTFAAKGALSVGPAENIEILVYLARHNKVFGDLARMTLAGWDEKSSLQAAADPHTRQEVLDYLVSPDNLRPKLLPALLENLSVQESAIAKLAISAAPDSIAVMLRSTRVRAAVSVLDVLKSNPYLKKEQSDEIRLLMRGEVAVAVVEPAAEPTAEIVAVAQESKAAPPVVEDPAVAVAAAAPKASAPDTEDAASTPEEEEAIAAFFFHHAAEIAADEGKPFQAIGGIVELLGSDYFPASPAEEIASEPTPMTTPEVKGGETKKAALAGKAAPEPGKRVNTVQKINALDVKGRIQLALKGSKEERGILIRDGTKVVCLAVLEAPKLSDGEVEKFASQKNVLEAVLRQIPLKRRFMKNYKVVRNLVANPRTPLDLGLGLMKNLLAADLKNISANKEVSETIRKLALKMFKQKEDQANKK
jgi:hypothetical protein